MSGRTCKTWPWYQLSSSPSFQRSPTWFTILDLFDDHLLVSFPQRDGHSNVLPTWGNSMSRELSGQTCNCVKNCLVGRLELIIAATRTTPDPISVKMLEPFKLWLPSSIFQGFHVTLHPKQNTKNHKKITKKIFKEKLHLVKVKMCVPGMTDGWKLAVPVCFIPIKKL